MKIQDFINFFRLSKLFNSDNKSNTSEEEQLNIENYIEDNNEDIIEENNEALNVVSKIKYEYRENLFLYPYDNFGVMEKGTK